MKVAAAALALFAAAPVLAAQPLLAAEPCRTQGQPAAAEVPLDPAHPSGLLASIPVVTKLHGLTSAGLAALPPACDRGRFEAGGRRYALTGESTDAYVPRRAGAGRGAPVVFLAESFDLAASLDVPAVAGAEPRGGARQTRWVLATALNDVMVVWRAYDAIPDDARLKADMTAALDPGATPVMRFDMKGGAVQILQ